MSKQIIYIGDNKVTIEKTTDSNNEELYIAYVDETEVGRNNIEDQLISDLRSDYR